MNTIAQGFALDALQVEPLTGGVSGPGGHEKLDPKVMDVLVYMAGHTGQVVLRDELLTRLWPNVVVSDDALTRCFYELRRCLVRAGGDERYRGLVETVPKRGYRLNATVRPLDAPPIPRPQPEAERPPLPRPAAPWLRVADAGAVLIAIAALIYLWRSTEESKSPAPALQARSIAVLPFLDMSEKQDQRYFSDGVTEEILNRLSQSETLRVTSRTSSFALRNESLDVPAIAERLNVDYVLEGSVRKAGGRVRITAQLIDVTTNAHAWSRTYDRAVDDVFAVQDEIASSVATALQASLAGGGSRQRMPANVAAYDKFLQGQFLYHRRSAGDIERAMAYYQQAVALDPDYGRAWAALAGAYSLAIGELHHNVNPQLRKLQGEAARKAVEVDPGLAVAHARLAQYYYHVQQQDLGDEHMRKAVALDPDDPLVLGFTATEAIWRGDYALAVDLWRKVVAQDPLSPVSRGNYGFMLLANGQLEDALAECRRALELNPNAGPLLSINIARTLILLGRHTEALPYIDQLPEGPRRDFVLALLHGAPGMTTKSDVALSRLAAAPKDIIGEVHLAEAYAYRGRKDEAFDALVEFNRRHMLERSENPRAWWWFQDEMRQAPLLRVLHNDPRWAELTAMPG